MPDVKSEEGSVQQAAVLLSYGCVVSKFLEGSKKRPLRLKKS